MNVELFFKIYGLNESAPWVPRLVFFIAQHLDTVLMVLIVVILLIFFIHDKDWKPRKFKAWFLEVLAIASSTTIALIVVLFAKVVAAAPRPFVTFAEVQPLVIESPYSSFPSGHATIFFALATAVWMYHRRLGYFFMVCAVLIAISRVMAGVHYPVDVIFGAAIGIFIAWLSTTFFQKKS
jgi:undecaprenyl-diphosphatase